MTFVFTFFIIIRRRAIIECALVLFLKTKMEQELVLSNIGFDHYIEDAALGALSLCADTCTMKIRLFSIIKHCGRRG